MRLVLVLISVLLGWLLAASVDVAATDPAQAEPLPSYVYDAHHHTSLATRTTTERGPPTAYDQFATQDTVVRWLVGASARPKTTAIYAYDDLPQLAQIDASGTGARKPASGAHAPVVPLTRAAVAAKTRKLDNVDDLPCNCFLAGTEVKTAKGEKPIEKIKIGDKVWAKNLTTGKNELRTVTGLFQKHTDQVMTITVVSGAQVTVTEEHPFYVAGLGWVMSGDLKVGDQLAQRVGGSTRIAGISIRPADTTVYNFTVSGDHNYYVTEAQLLVHNCPVPGVPKDFIPPTNPASHPPTSLPDGYVVRSMPATSQYPNGYGRLTNERGQYLDPSTMKPPSNVTRAMFRAMTHIEFPAP